MKNHRMKGVKLTHSQPFKAQFGVSGNVSNFALITFPLSYFRNHTVKSKVRNAYVKYVKLTIDITVQAFAFMCL